MLLPVVAPLELVPPVELPVPVSEVAPELMGSIPASLELVQAASERPDRRQRREAAESLVLLVIRFTVNVGGSLDIDRGGGLEACLGSTGASVQFRANAYPGRTASRSRYEGGMRALAAWPLLSPGAEP